jgi:hypothetical protein
MAAQRRLLRLLSAAAVAFGFAAAVITPAHAASNATVSILHGVDATVDVYVNGKALLRNFKPGTLTDPQMLPAGSYDLEGFNIVDISIEPYDGNPAHSRNSQVRGVLPN